MDLSVLGRWNLDAIEAAYDRWRLDPASVDGSWRHLFDQLQADAAATMETVRPASDGAAGATADHVGNVIRLIDGYRELGHMLARLDPLSEAPSSISLLEPASFGFQESDLPKQVDTRHFLGFSQGSLQELLAALRQTYCRTIGVEYMHIEDSRVRRWLEERMEPSRNSPAFDHGRKRRILRSLHSAEHFERFLHTNYVGQKRFSLEGAETLIPLLDALVERAADHGVREIVLGMSHRGRLNVLANILGKPLAEIFHEFEENYQPLNTGGDGDVRYHHGFSSDRVSERGNRIHLSMSPNPSHLEAVDPVVEGRTRAKQDRFSDPNGVLGMPVLIHGDAAFAAQGVVAETLNLSQLKGYKTGGTFHVVVNNQIGFTTCPSDGRSTVYCTDIARMLDVPIFHVNSEDPEAAVFVTELAFDFRQTFHEDVFIDLVCYRRHGHNEGDEPSFTQPKMYEKIANRPTMSKIYTDQLLAEHELTAADVEEIDKHFEEKLKTAKEDIHHGILVESGRAFGGAWKGLQLAYDFTPVDTGISHELLLKLGTGLTSVPDHVHVNAKLRRILERRRQDLESGKPIDWSLAEALAFGSLLVEGTAVRLSGQDSQRGTFSQRHAVLVDAETEEQYFPLKALDPQQAPFMIYDSPLSETGVLGFEFGYSMDRPEVLVLWEAQFGDFVNGAQVIIDQFLVCSQSKWQRDSGLVLLLPHGYEGQGPEHSNGRPERFLQMCAEENIEVCNPTTPAQYFHLLRRQMRRKFRRPLVIFTPKSLLRHKRVMSGIDEFASASFERILDDTKADPNQVRRVLLCSGKIYYDLVEKRENNHAEVAIVRVEQWYPLTDEQLRQPLVRYRRSNQVVWVQEEPQNMGGWTYMENRLRGIGCQVNYVGRDASASSATGSRQIHLREQAEIVEAALAGQVPHIVQAAPKEDASWPQTSSSRPSASQSLKAPSHAG
jgi:2-oxoglutarate dehydrogenase E1 component